MHTGAFRTSSLIPGIGKLVLLPVKSVFGQKSHYSTVVL
jgi:hypothetical protein